MRWKKKCCNFCNKLFLFTPKAGAWHCDPNTLLAPHQPPAALPSGNGILDILGIFPSPLRVRRGAVAAWKACQLFWNSCRCLKSEGFFREAHLHLSCATGAKACGVFVCWFDRLTCNGQGPGAAAPSKVTLIAGVLQKSAGLNSPWFFSALQRGRRCSNVPFGFHNLFLFVALF